MNSIHILDCTLRDGGYCNKWKFGFENIKKITFGLQKAGVEIIECGFLTDCISYNPDVTMFTMISDVSKVLPANRTNEIYVLMMNYGEYDVDKLPYCDGNSIDGIRIAFHKKNWRGALELSKKIKAKGYLVFIQAMVSLNYSDEEFLSIIREVNKIQPYAFYIVDSFGVMKEKELIRLFCMIDHNLDNEIWVGFHAHNNMQLAYSNAQKLVKTESDRNIIIDCSVYGMGRGAGNLNTELFVGYLNENAGKEYRIKPILSLIDAILNEFYLRNYWGYSLPNYISASYNAHPNYASYLDDKKSLTVEAMNEIFELMDEDKKVYFDREYIESLYDKYMESGENQEYRLEELYNNIKERDVLLIAPGMSSIEEKDAILDFVRSVEGIKVISINHSYSHVNPDLIFVSNLRRYREIKDEEKNKCIVTSNIPAAGVYCKLNYSELLNDTENVIDNAGLMAIKFLINAKSRHIYLAGFDGYTHNVDENYGMKNLRFTSKNSSLDAMNIGMNKVLGEYEKIIEISFVTKKRIIG